MPSTRGLEPKNQFWANLAKKTYQAVTPEPYFQFSQANTHFIQNPEENLMST